MDINEENNAKTERRGTMSGKSRIDSIIASILSQRNFTVQN